MRDYKFMVSGMTVLTRPVSRGWMVGTEKIPEVRPGPFRVPHSSKVSDKPTSERLSIGLRNVSYGSTAQITYTREARRYSRNAGSHVNVRNQRDNIFCWRSGRGNFARLRRNFTRFWWERVSRLNALVFGFSDRSRLRRESTKTARMNR